MMRILSRLLRAKPITDTPAKSERSKDELFDAILRERERLHRAELLRSHELKHPCASDCYIAEKKRSIEDLESEYRRTSE